MSRFLVQTRRRGPSALARVEQAIERRGRPSTDDACRAAVGDDDRVCVLIDVPATGRDATGRAEQVFEEVWYDAFGDSGGGHLTIALW